MHRAAGSVRSPLGNGQGTIDSGDGLSLFFNEDPRGQAGSIPTQRLPQPSLRSPVRVVPVSSLIDVAPFYVGDRVGVPDAIRGLDPPYSGSCRNSCHLLLDVLNNASADLHTALSSTCPHRYQGDGAPHAQR